VPAKFNPIYDRHHDIAYHDIRLKRIQDLKRAASIGSSHQFVVFLLQQVRKQGGYFLIVVND
jgi:hypothetical protein